ncbi:MAG: hypothetical protein CVU11_16125 [Bacteroidetes bacterium HGW-Bacteroidetes-6]|nr:MAG: hypothetical protein CVU11_16125 [Bacteroidetes bacterium HGW-Bacteroidetes-6]
MNFHLHKMVVATFIMLATTTQSYAWTTPTMSSPLNGSTLYAGVTLDWNAVASSAGYQLQVDTAAGFNSPVKYSVFKTYINSSSGNSDTQQFLDDLFFGKTYYWRVRAYNTGDTSAWTSAWTFITRDYVTLATPTTGSSVYAGYTMDWYPHTGVDYYDFEADTSALFNSPAKKSATKTYINSSDGNSDTYHFLDDLYFGKTYYWRVRARNAVDTTAWSTVWTFITRDYVTLSTPASGSSVYAGYTMDWYPHTGVDYYDFEADTSALFNSPAKKSATKTYINSSDGNSDTYHFLDDLYFGKTYYWRVRARNAVDTTAWSTVWTFNVVDYVTLSSPTSGSLQWTGLGLDWAPHTGVDYYDMEADTSLGFSSSAYKSATKAYINSSNGNADTYHFLDDLYFGKTYYWHVRARNAVDTSEWSGVWNYTTADYVVLSSPTDGLTNVSTSGTILDWAPHVGVDFYQLQIDTTNLFNSISLITLDKAYINSSNGNSDTYQTTGPLLSNQIYFWRVRAINAVDTSGWTVRSFNTGSGTILLPAVPTLVSPANTATGQAVALMLDWNTSANATSYEYEYADNASFFSSVSGTTTNTYANISGLNAPGITYYWRVRSKNGTSIYSDYSSVWSFTTGCFVAPPSISGIAPLCDSGSVTMIASNGTIFKWYDAATGGTLLFTGSSYTTPMLYSTTTYYIASVDGVCESSRTPATVVIGASPSIPVIYQTGNSIYTDVADSYQWYISGVLIGGATSQFYNPPASGTYTVVITDASGCSSESDPFNFVISSIISTENATLLVYPNPTFGMVNIRGAEGEITLTDVVGRILLKTNEYNVDMSEYASGVYFLSDASGKIIRVVKQ